MARKVTIPGQNVPIQIGNAVNPDWYLVLKFLEQLNPLSDQDYTALLAQIAATYSPIVRPPNVITSNHTLLNTEHVAPNTVYAPSADITISIPNRGVTTWQSGQQFDFFCFGGFKAAFSFGTNNVVFSSAGYTKIAPNSGGMLYFYGDDGTNAIWFLGGNLSA